MIFKNEASEILRKDPRKVTAGEAHDIYKIFYDKSRESPCF